MGSLPVLETQRWTRTSPHWRTPWTQEPEVTAHRTRAGGKGSQDRGGGAEGPLSSHGGVFRAGFLGKKTPSPALDE